MTRAPGERPATTCLDHALEEEGRQSTALPIEIGFLARHGHAPETLRQAAILAGFTGVRADEFCLKHKLVGEIDFYRSLAVELGVRFLPAPRLSRAAAYPGAILAGLAPLQDPAGDFVLAPRGETLARLLGSRRLSGRHFCITAPSLLARAVFQAQAARIAYRAAHDLPASRPDLSSHGGASLPQIAVLSALTLLLSAGAVLAPDRVFTVMATGLSPLFFGLVVLRLATAIIGAGTEPAAVHPRAADASLPVYTVIVALYRERRVAARLIAALARLDYPAAKLDVKLVLEADDRDSLAALAAIDRPGFIDVIVAPPGFPRTKPRALNVALPLARGRFTVVFDAEDVPDPGQLRMAAAAFERLPPEVACLQARLTIDNTDDTWLTKLFTIEYATLFDAFNPGLAEIGSPILLGGTSNHFRTSLLKDTGGWDAWNVTEDADLGIRLARLGYRVADLPSSTSEEAPGTLRAWLRQRTRWMKGFMQTAICHSRNPWRALRQLGPWRFCGAVFLTAGTVLSALLYPLFMGWVLIVGLHDAVGPDAPGWRMLWYSLSLMLLLFGAASALLPACVALHRRRLHRLLPWVLLLPFYYALVSLAAWRGLWELATSPFRWNKTSHGHARTSRAGLLQKHQAKVAVTRSLKTNPP